MRQVEALRELPRRGLLHAAASYGRCDSGLSFYEYQIGGDAPAIKEDLAAAAPISVARDAAARRRRRRARGPERRVPRAAARHDAARRRDNGSASSSAPSGFTER